MNSAQDVLKELKAKAKSSQLEGMTRYGIAIENRLGVSIPDLRKLAKQIGKNHLMGCLIIPVIVYFVF